MLVVGLGNPGAKYHGTRHNAGFTVLNRVAERLNAPPFQDRCDGAFATVRPGFGLFKPMTFMNLSGGPVRAAMRFLNVAASHVLVIHDELDLPYGSIVSQMGGNSGGHKGVQSVVEHCSDAFARVRVGIGRPSRGESIVGYVLAPWADPDAAIERAAGIVLELIATAAQPQAAAQ